jgi:hypothetical protein
MAEKSSASRRYDRTPIAFTSVLRRIIGGFGDTKVGMGEVEDEKLRDYLSQGYYFHTIELLVNPSSIAWAQPKRIVPVDTFEGTAFFHFSNSKGQNNDILTLTFRGSTGNIDPRSIGNTEFGVGASHKWLTWHNLYQLSREPMRLANGQENLVTISYASPLFPSANDSGAILELTGYFMNVIAFEESAQNPNSRNYEFMFSVIKTEPSIDQIGEFVTFVSGDGGREL